MDIPFVIIVLSFVITSSKLSALLDVEVLHGTREKGKHHYVLIENNSDDTIFYNKVHNCFTYDLNVSEPDVTYEVTFKTKDGMSILGDRCLIRTDTGMIINLTAHKRIVNIAINRKGGYQDWFSEIPNGEQSAYVFYMPRKIRRDLLRNKVDAWVQFDYWQHSGDTVKQETRFVKIE